MKSKTKKVNIAIVITRLELGGAQQVALYLARHLDRKKFNVHLIAGRGGMLDEKTGKEPKAQIPRVELWDEIVHPIRPDKDLAAYRKLKKYFIENKIDVVNTHSSKAGLLGRLAARAAGVKKTVHTVHGFPFHKYQNPVMHWGYVLLEKFAAAFTHKLVAVGNDVKEYGLKKGVGKPGQYEVIRAGVDLKKFMRQKTKDRSFIRAQGLDPKLFTVGMIGNLKKQKNYKEFIEIAKEATAGNDKIQFVFAGGHASGSGSVETGSDRARFIGWTDQPEVFMASLDCFLLTSLWEGLPCTLVQAAAAGKYIIATDIYGNREFVKLAGGFLYEPGNIRQAAQRILQLAGRPVKIKPAAGFLMEFGSDFMLKKYEKLFGEK